MTQKLDLIVLGVSVGVALGILIATLVFLGLRWYKKHARLRRCANERSFGSLPIRMNGIDANTDLSAVIGSPVTHKPDHTQRSTQPSRWGYQSKDRPASFSGVIRYSYKDIQKATQNFTTTLGEGSFGPVYKAVVPTGEIVAVKVLASNSRQGEKEFQTEVSLLGRLHHRNLVNLVGYSVDKGQHMLIYEFMCNGSLANLLYNQKEQSLSWEERLQIAMDIAHGIEYLHEGAVPSVIHRDLKSANILLDQSMRAKVADFGLSKEEVFDDQNSSLKGTYGYIDPVYISTNQFTKKSDIYSLGVIIFELITAIHPQQNLIEYVNLAGMSSDGIDEILDKELLGQCNIEEVRELARIGHKCLHKFQRKRPSIVEVSQAVVKMKHRQLARNNTMSFASQDISLVVSKIEDQQVELSELTSREFK
ncbi:hypothetical protein K2173_025870 [Erythroxylum novogranatense]|uniref:non-specific serine/threonine protein kinase n=1 Tax=Erythroxylum novogranatense TaxID=1862640 RepID=A0AAV8SHG5_9ROSI|nr:hypothetical protein K2173_025870 [Erythroxylum novogranatense]